MQQISTEGVQDEAQLDRKDDLLRIEQKIEF